MKYNAERQQIELSVGELCDLALLSGDIDCRRSSHSKRYDRAKEGGAIHRKLQNEFGPSYHSEVELKNVSKLDEIYFYPPAQHAYQCSICGRACDVACYVHLEEKGVLKKKFKTHYRKREEWRFDIESFK